MADEDFGGLTPGFLAGQAHALERIATGAPLGEVLQIVARLIEAQIPRSLCSILLLDEDGIHLRLGAAPGLPAGYSAAIDGLAVGSDAGSCGAAAATGETVITSDIAADARWAKWRGLALGHGLRACWSVPVLDQDKRVLGTFAVYFHEPVAPPGRGWLEMLGAAAHLAAVAIARERQFAAHQRSEDKWRAIFEHSLDAIFLFDDTRRLVDANPAACELLGAPRAGLIGQPVENLAQPLPRPGLGDSEDRWARFQRTGSVSQQGMVRRADGSTRYAAFRSRANFLPGLHLCAARDITEQRLTEEAVRCAEQLYRTLVETTGTGYVVTDEKGRVLDANADYIRLTGYPDLDAIRGRSPLEWTAHTDRQRLGIGMALCFNHGTLRNMELEFANAQGQTVPVELNATAVHTEEGSRLLALCHNITGRIQTRHELQAAQYELESRVQRRTAELARATEQIRSRARQQESVAELGRRALAGTSIDALMQEAAETVATILDVEFSAVLEHADPESDDLVLRACAGWPNEAFGRPAASTDPAYAPGYALRTLEPVVCENLGEESRFRPLPGMREAGFVSGVTVAISGDPQPFGVIDAHSKEPREFTADDTHFLQSIANVLAAAVERTRSEQIVRLAQQSAVSANNAKIEFLSRMSHELRTPLNAILGFSQLLEIDRLSGNQRESVEQITRAGRHLLELVNEVLDISRIDSGNMALTPEPLAVDELLREGIDLIRPLADARRIELIAEPGGMAKNRFVLADRQRVRQVLINLLSNAVKYNHEGGRVSLDGGPSPDGKRLRLLVRDTGVGIAPENLSRLFTPFERLGAENTDVEGSGMGLALSKRLIESQGGDLGVETAPGAGSTFWVDLPVAAAPEESSSELFDALLEPGLLAEAEASVEDQPPPPPKPPRTILHIEDNEANRLLITMLVAQRPAVRLLTASRGQEGLALAREHHPDLILLDIHLPDTSGETVLRDLRADAETCRTPIVMVSADATAQRRIQTHAAGADNYLTKPFNVGQFMKILDEYVSKEAA